MNSSCSSKFSLCKWAIAWQGIEWILFPKGQRRPLPFLLYFVFLLCFSFMIVCRVVWATVGLWACPWRPTTLPDTFCQMGWRLPVARQLLWANMKYEHDKSEMTSQIFSLIRSSGQWRSPGCSAFTHRCTINIYVSLADQDYLWSNPDPIFKNARPWSWSDSSVTTLFMQSVQDWKVQNR